MITLAYLLMNSRTWLDAEVTLKMMVGDEQAARDAEQNLSEMIKRLRMDIKTKIIISEGKTFNTVLHESSKDADLIFMGMAKPDKNFSAYYESLQKRLEGLPTTVMVLVAEEISFGEILMQQDIFGKS